MSFKAIIFDLDGTLIDNHHHWAEADSRFLRKYNIDHTQEYISLVNGRSMREAVVHIKDRYNLFPSVDDLLEEKTKITDHIYDVAEARPGAHTLLNLVKQKYFKTAIASGAPLVRIEKIVSRFNWQPLFLELVSVDHVNHVGKPDPAVYLYAAEKLGVDPRDCLVVEDARNGLLAAKRAGMSCVMVHSSPHEDVSEADQVFHSLEDKGFYTFLGL